LSALFLSDEEPSTSDKNKKETEEIQETVKDEAEEQKEKSEQQKLSLLFSPLSTKVFCDF
jgi:hypothetical protein